MSQFFKIFFAAFLALIVFFVLSLFILIGIGAAASQKETPQISENSILKLDLDVPISERAIEDPFEDLNIPGFQTEKNIGLLELKKAIDKAAKDEKIKGIYLPSGFIEAGFSKLDEIRSSLEDFKKSGKFIVAFSEIISEPSYYLLSVADSIYLYPTGYMELNGFYSETVFISGFLEKIGVKPLIFKAGNFKSAVEPFLRKSMSEENKEQISHLLTQFKERYISKVAASRKLPKERLTTIIDSMLVRTAVDAQQHGLITRVAYYDEVEAVLKNLSSKTSKEKIKFVTLDKYMEANKISGKASSKNRIAVLYADGDIVDGSGDDDQVYSDQFRKELKKLREDDKVKAIVLRVNSPGGSALASDVIWREIELTKKEKPIIASMSSVAASGGYYISMACDSVLANANTITGSIGVFGILFNAKELVNEKLGVYSDGVKTGKFSDLGDPDRDMTDYEKSMIQHEIDQIYDDFTSKAAKSRGLTKEALLEIASGRVWTGNDAVENGLVDAIGDLDDAISIAAKKAKLGDDYLVRNYPEQKTVIEKIMSGLENETESRAKAELGEFYVYHKMYQQIKTWQNPQARLPFEFNMR